MISTSRTKFLSENYSALHGLNAVPFGLCLFLTSLWANVVPYPIKDFLLPIILLPGALALYWVIGQYYKNTFGEIQPTRAKRRLYWTAQALGGILGLVAFWLDSALSLPISFIGLLFASVLLFENPMVSVPLNRFSVVRLGAAICLLLVSITPVFLGRSWWNMLGVRAMLVGVTMCVGVVMVLQGVLWHIFFVRSLPQNEALNE